MTKAEALAKIEEAKANIASLEAFVDAGGQEEAARPIAERFTTVGGRTGVILSIPRDVSDLSMPIVEYLVRSFVGRGGVLWGDIEDRIKVWRDAKFSLREPLWMLWKGSAEKTYKALSAQPTVGEVVGQTLVFLLDTAQEDLMEDEVDVANPVAWLSLFLSLDDPKNVNSYPALKGWNWEWVGALTKTEYGTCALGGGSFSVGLCLGWGAPGRSGAGYRARSVVAALAG
jgi:hypothetical protein